MILALIMLRFRPLTGLNERRNTMLEQLAEIFEKYEFKLMSIIVGLLLVETTLGLIAVIILTIKKMIEL